MTAIRRLRGQPLLVLALVGILVALPYLVAPYYVNVAIQILVFGLFAASLGVLAGHAGLISLGHAGLLGTSAYVFAIAMGRWGWSFWAAGGLAVVVTCGVTAVLAVMAVRVVKVYFLMVTLAQGMLLWGISQRWVSLTDGDNGLRGADRPPAFTEYYAYYWLVLSVVLLVLLGLWAFLRSDHGLRIRGTRDSASRMASLGYSVVAHRLIAFNVAGLVAGIAGVLYVGFTGFVSPSTLFLRTSVEGLLMVIIGGVGTFAGPLVGAAAVIIARTIVTTYTDRWSSVMGLLLITTILFAPQGIVGGARRLAARLRGASSTPVGPSPVANPPPTDAAPPSGDEAAAVAARLTSRTS